MSSYHSSFGYLGKNSMVDYNLMITHFDNYDNGETESFLSLDPVYRDSYRNTKRTLYGTKYNSVALLDITVIHTDKSEFTIEQTRAINRWLTGSRQYTWMDLYVDEDIVYRIHCYVKDIKPYKMDSRIIGFVISVESSSPWYYSSLQTRQIAISGRATFEIECETDDVYNYIPLKITFQEDLTAAPITYGEDGVVVFSPNAFAYNENTMEFDAIDEYTVDTNSDGYLSAEYSLAPNTSTLQIINKTINNETTVVENLLENETIIINENLMIQSDRPQRIFGDSFNYIWPRIKYGTNEFEIFGYGNLILEYVYPIKAVGCVKHDVLI